MPPQLRDIKVASDIFAIIRKGDILLHHPYDSFQPVMDFLRMRRDRSGGARDQDCLYRVGQNSPVVETLLEAQEEDKQVAALVELKARFDEESNIGWARALEGRRGSRGLWPDGVEDPRQGDTGGPQGARRAARAICTLPSGNYNAVTAAYIPDSACSRANAEIAARCHGSLQYLTGYSNADLLSQLLVGALHLRRAPRSNDRPRDRAQISRTAGPSRSSR